MDLQKPRIFIGGILGAVTLAGIYVLWGPAVSKKRNFRGYIPGLQNLGNSCFLNAVLQALSSCETIIRWLDNIPFPTSYLNKNKSLMSVLLKTLKELNYYESTTWKQDVCSPAHVIRALHSRGWVISSDEQDAHELFHALTTTIEEEMSECHSVSSLLDISALQETSQKDGKLPIETRTKFRPSSLHISKLDSPTRGMLASQLQCRNCGYKYPVCFDVFDSISLPMPNSFWGHLRIQDCLQKFISTECIQDVDCKECSLRKKQNMLESKSNTSEKSQFTKRLVIGKLPDCLCFHIQRTVWLSNGIPSKRGDHIVFPEFLSMGSYIYPHCQQYQNCNVKSKSILGGRIIESLKTHISPSTYINSEKTPDTSVKLLNSSGNSAQKNTYQLKSVIVHLGDVFSGHFLTYRRGPLHTPTYNRWFCVSDASVREVSISEVLQSSVYMLFYERCHQRY